MAAALWRLIRYLHLTILLFLWTNAYARDYGEVGRKCLTPNGEEGRCYSIFSCNAHKRILAKRPIYQNTAIYLRKGRCGLEGGLPMLCCPVSGKQPRTTVIEPFKIQKGSCRPSIDEDDGTTRPITPIDDNNNGDQGDGGTTRPTSTTNDGRLDVWMDDSTATTTTTTTSKPFIPPKTEDRWVSTGPEVVDHPNWKYLNNDICGEDAGDRIIGGEEAELTQFPWLAVLKFKTGERIEFACGGALISKRYVLTAAHCHVDMKDSELVGVRLGEQNIKTDPDCELNVNGIEICAAKYQEFNISKFIAHPGYKSYTLNRYHDISLLRLDRDAVFNEIVQPICLPNGEAVTKRYEGKSMFVAGWGWSEKNILSDVKLWIQLPVVNNTDCQCAFEDKLTIGDKQMCAGGEKGKDSCRGDSGGPLMTTDLIQDVNRGEVYVAVGIVSLGYYKCATENLPAVYTRVGPYMNWILDNLEP